MIIGLTGPSRSGKDTVANHLVESYGFKHYDFYRDVLMGEIKKRGMEVTKMNASIIGDELRKKHGQGVMAELLFTEAVAPRIVVTGVRSPAEVEYFRSKTDKFYLILVKAPAELRFERRIGTDPNDMNGFLVREENDRKKGIYEVFGMADADFDNNGTVDNLYTQVDEWLKGVLE